MEAIFEGRVAAGEIAGAALLAHDKQGILHYAQTFGVRSLKDKIEKPPMTLDTVMRIMSCSKLIISVMCLQGVNRGLLDLDGDVTPLLPEIGNLPVLTGFSSDGAPLLQSRRKPLTMRHLLTHSSGLSYDLLHPLLVQYRAHQGIQPQPLGDKIEDRFLYPLVYEPGDGWTYGPGIDWAGRLLERAYGNGRLLEDLLQEHVCAPLDITDMTFRLQTRADMQARRAEMSERDPLTGDITYIDLESWHHDPIDAMGGHGIFTSPASYMKVLSSLLLDDGKLLKPSAVDQLFQSSLTPQASQALTAVYEVEQMNTVMGALLPPGVKKSHALGGMLILEDVEEGRWRSEGTLVWSGYPNCYWFIDRKAGLCAMYASQLQPPGDAKTIELGRLFERTMYERLAAAKALQRT